MTPAAFAAAFSGHRFSETYPDLDPDITWDVVGGPTLEDPDAVIQACEETLLRLRESRVEFSRMTVIDAGDRVVVDSLARYESPAETTSVASCDIYEFREGRCSAIRSYNVELPADA